MKHIIRGFCILLSVVLVLGMCCAVMMGPLYLGQEYNNPWFLALYAPHALAALYLIGCPDHDHSGVSGPETLV